jgi:hypothetical protein
MHLDALQGFSYYYFGGSEKILDANRQTLIYGQLFYKVQV